MLPHAIVISNDLALNLLKADSMMGTRKREREREKEEERNTIQIQYEETEIDIRDILVVKIKYPLKI